MKTKLASVLSIKIAKQRTFAKFWFPVTGIMTNGPIKTKEVLLVKLGCIFAPRFNKIIKRTKKEKEVGEKGREGETEEKL